MTPDAHARARQLIDNAHAVDPSRAADGRPAELAYADNMERWLAQLVPTAPPLLRLAARAQHLERWTVARSSYPEGKAGYLAWRRFLYTKQAARARALLLEAGATEAEADDVATWVSKQGLKTNPGTQALEDAACLVFLENEITDFAAQHADYAEEKFLEILRKTWKKMSPPAHALAQTISHSPQIAALIARATAPSPETAPQTSAHSEFRTPNSAFPQKPALLVLAAGMGSRFGGPKQIAPVGPSGEILLDYSVFDAMRAGFGRVVLLIRRDFEEIFRTQICAKYAGRVAVDYAFQSVDALPEGFAVPAGREKPWGTAHAAWCAREIIHEPFAVINADDFYGADAFRKLAAHLGSASEGEAALVGYKLSRTLSENGSVARGVCDVSPGGWLRSVTEHTGILKSQVGVYPENKYTGGETVSMNCWGFMPGIFGAIDRQLRAFLQSDAARMPGGKAEFYLPAAVSALIAQDGLRVRALAADADWFGVTYPDDRARVTAALAALVARGEYPGKLFA